VKVPGEAPKPGSVTVVNAGADFLSTMQMPMQQGRELTERDMTGAGSVAVVNELFAKTYFADGMALGRHFHLSASAIDFEVVGVTPTARMISLKQEINPMVYVPYTKNPRQSQGQMVYEIRASGDAASLAGAVRRIVSQADSRVPVSEISTQARRMDQMIGQERTFATLCTCFAVLAVLISCVGLYGTMAYRVARRTNEIGIRMALGAERRGLIWLVQRDVLLMAAAGLAIGIPVARASSSVVESYLFGLKSNDWGVTAMAAIVLVAAALVAGLGPAWKASRLDPWTALRDE
jgi:predicted permease